MDQTISLDAVIGFLVSTPLFDGLDSSERADVVRIMEVRRLQEGEQIFKEGDPGDAWYVVFEGEARVVKDEYGVRRDVATLGSGTCFGEMAILDGSPRSASVEAGGPLTVFRFQRARFNGLLDQGSLGAYKLVLGMARTLSLRQRQLTRQVSELMRGDGVLEGVGVNAGIDEDVDRFLVSE